MAPRLIIGLLFVLSGATSLVYQVVWVRNLSLFFGSDVYAAAIMLSVFMGGLALGSWAAGATADRLGKPLLVYGACEILIGLSALAFPEVLGAFRGTYQSIYRSSFESAPYLYHGFRVVVAAVTLLVPTALMGATLPLIIRQFADRDDILGRRVGAFYAVNTLGALLGTLLAGFVCLPAFGVSRTVSGTVLVNLGIGVIALVIGARLPALREPERLGRSGESNGPRLAARPVTTAPPATHARRVLVAMMLSGFAALALEVVWMRILVQSFSATVYAFSIMLASFLFGIFYGSHLASRTIDKDPEPADSLATLEFWLGGSVAVLAMLTHGVPVIFGRLLWRLAAVTGGAFGVASIIAQGTVALILIAVPALLLGATFPFAVKAFTRDIGERSHGTGSIYAANTAGGVLGALAGAMVLLPMVGARGSLVVIAFVFVMTGAFLARGRGARRTRSLPPALLVAAAAIFAVVVPPRLSVNFNLQDLTGTSVIYHGEGVSQTVDILRSPSGHTIMMVNGNIEADTTFTQRRHFILKAHLPLLLQPHPHDLAVVGLGLGVTLRAATRYPAVESIRLIELSPEMVKAHEHLRDLTGSVLDDPKLRLRIDDGRNFMAMSDEQFDMITADPIHPRITGVGYLYTREYYQQIQRHLRPGGIAVQWMPMYNISLESFDVAFRTFVSVFPNTSFWYVRGHGLLVGTADPFAIDYPALAARFTDPKVSEDFASIEMKSPEDFLGTLLMDTAHVVRYLARNGDRTLNTDDNAYLEYQTPFEFLDRTESLVDALLPFAGWDVARVLQGASEETRARVQRLAGQRRQQLRPELGEALK